MPARSVFPGLKRIPKPDGTVAWAWAALQLARNHKGFRPRAVQLWRSYGEPTADQQQLIAAECQQLSGALREYLATNRSPRRRAHFVLGTIYFAKAGDRVKIGFSKNALQRVSDVQVGCPDQVELIGAMAGTPAIERHIHHRFRALRLRGEWFQLDRRLLDFIADEASRTAENKGKTILTVERQNHPLETSESHAAA